MKMPVGSDIPVEAGVLDPQVRDRLLRERRGEALLGCDVSEIHRYPLRPPGFEEPLFPTTDPKRSVIEHLLGAPWLSRASELEGRSGGAARALEGPVELRGSQRRAKIVRPGVGSRRRLRRVYLFARENAVPATGTVSAPGAFLRDGRRARRAG